MDLLPRKLWGRPGTVWCLPSCPRLNKRFHWGVALCGLSRSRGWPVQRHSAIAWLPWVPGGENGHSLDAPASPCLLIFDDFWFRFLSGYRPKRGHESVMASEHRTSGLVSNISHGPPLLRRIDERISPRVKSSGMRDSTLVDQKHNQLESVLIHASWITLYDIKKHIAAV